MNRERMLQVANAIEVSNRGERVQLESMPSVIRFDMTAWSASRLSPVDDTKEAAECETAACVAGFAYALCIGSAAAVFAYALPDSVPVTARTWLDLTLQQSMDLFTPMDVILSAVSKRKHQVPDAIRWMAETGTVSWKEAFQGLGDPLKATESLAA